MENLFLEFSPSYISGLSRLSEEREYETPPSPLPVSQTYCHTFLTSHPPPHTHLNKTQSPSVHKIQVTDAFAFLGFFFPIGLDGDTKLYFSLDAAHFKTWTVLLSKMNGSSYTYQLQWCFFQSTAIYTYTVHSVQIFFFRSDWSM